MGPDDLRRLILQFTDIFPNAHHRSPKWNGMTLAVAHALGLVGQPIFRPIVVMGHSITNNGNINDDNRFGLCELSDQPGIYLWVSRHFVRTALGAPAVDWKLWRQNHIYPHDNDCLCYPHSLHPDGIIDRTLSDLLVSLGGVLDGNIQPGRWPYAPPSDPDWENWPDSPIAPAREHEGARIDIWYPGSPCFSSES
jgi:hypothetical protein